ncbi:MAG: ABC transporter ATP-binding protein/permease [Actinomycetes bacterium]|jgi:ATP-binding cassette subfamily B protein|nr:ABC transporter ATP-binding protein/permease [Actinomycetes bacterium]
MASTKGKFKPSAGMKGMSFSHMAKILSRLMGYVVKPRKARFTFAVICVLISAAVIAYNIRFTQTVIDSFIVPLLKMQSPDFTTLNREVIRQVIVVIIGFAANVSYAVTMAVIAQEVQRDLRDKMFNHMQTLPIGYFDSRSFGDVMSYYTNDIDTLRQMIGTAIPQIITNVAFIVCCTVIMLITNVWLTILVAIVLALCFILLRVVTNYSSTFFKVQQGVMGKLNGFIEETVSGQKVVKVFSHEAASMDEFSKLNEDLRQAAFSANRNANILQPIIGNLGHELYVLTALIGGILMVSGFGGVTIGIIGSFLQFGRQTTNNWSQMSMQLNFVVQACAGAERIFTHLDELEEQDGGDISLVNVSYAADGTPVETAERTGHWAWKDGNKLLPLTGDIELKHVDFSYVPDRQILHDITMSARPGEKVALIGATGAGKTTITNLINRFYDIDSGSITYDGIDIARIKKPDLRHSLGVVLQEAALFTGTVYDNIRYGRLDASDEEIVAAAELVNADDFIRTLPQGYNTVLAGNSEDLSAGQRQLLTLARAAISDPPVMVLDEATSSIDTRTESMVQAGMDALMEGRTVFVIAHRLSTIVNSDVIMVMEQGRIIESGRHAELMEKKGRYYELYTGVFDFV